MFRKTQLITMAVISGLYASQGFAAFYVGADIGPEIAHFKQKVYVGKPGIFNAIDTNHFSGTGGFGSLYIGYASVWNQVYLAGEANINASTVRYRLTNDEFLHNTVSKTTFSVHHSEGISLIPGYLVSSDTLFYGRVGYANGRLKIVESDPTIASSRNDRDGIRYGLGIQHYFTKEWSMRMEYSQINYKGVKGTVFEPFGMVTKETKISPFIAQVAFGLIYTI